MASGHVHVWASFILAFPVGIVGAYWMGGPAVGVLAAMGCGIGGILLSPDLDTSECKEIVSETVVYRNAGWFLGKTWSLLWYPYAKLMRHRGTSHWPIVGTATRLLYLAIPIFILAKWQGWTLAIPIWPWPLVAGLGMSDTLHWLMDGMPM